METSDFDGKLQPLKNSILYIVLIDYLLVDKTTTAIELVSITCFPYACDEIAHLLLTTRT